MPRTSLFNSILLLKCPKCRKGKLFQSNVLENKGIYNMPNSCPNCHQDFQIEPGFYWGAMYMGYALSSGYFLIVTSLIYVYTSLSLYASFGISIVFSNSHDIPD